MVKRLRIGIDGRVLGLRAKGIGRYIWELCKGLDTLLPHAEFYLYSVEATGLPQISGRWHERLDHKFAKQVPKSLWAVTRLGLLARQDSVDVFWGGTGLLPFYGLSGRAIVTVHDFVHRIMPSAMSRRALWTMKLFFEPSLARADAIVTNSEGTARRLYLVTGYSAAAVVRPGISPAFVPQSETSVSSVLSRYSLRGPYILGVSTLEPRKGLDRLIRAFSNLQAQRQLAEYTLVLVGDRGWRDASLAHLVKHSGPKIVWLGFVEDSELVALYTGCEAFVYPSSYEGFGMPVLEARACGATVVTTDSPELREAGGRDTIYVSPTEAGISEGIAAAIRAPKNKKFDAARYSWMASSAILARQLTDERRNPATLGQ